MPERQDPKVATNRFILAFIHLISALIFTPLLLRIFYVILNLNWGVVVCRMVADVHKIRLSAVNILSSVVFTPVLARLLYVLLYREYRKFECYRIMAQQVLLHVICGVCYVFYGLGVVLDSEIWEFVKAAHFICINAFICIVMITFVLALNRLVLICHLHIPRFISPTLQVITWVFFIVLNGIMYTPLSEITLGKDRYSITYEKTRWFSANYSTMRFYFGLVLIFAALGMYILISMYVLYRKCLFKSSSANKAELKVGIQAGLTFLSNFLTLMVYMFLYEYVKRAAWSKDAYALGQMANFLYIPSFVFLGFNKKLRHQVFFYKKKTINAIHGTNILVTSSK